MKTAVFLASVLILSSASASAAVIVKIAPLAQTASLGSTAYVEIAISGLALHAAPSLGAYDLNLAFDPAILSFTGLMFGDPIQTDQLDLSGTGSVSGFSTPAAGELEFYEISLDPSAVLDSQQSGAFVLATANFRVIGSGTATLMPSINAIGNSAGAALSAGVQTGTVQIAAVPEPNTLVLLLPIFALVAWQVVTALRYRSSLYSL